MVDETPPKLDGIAREQAIAWLMECRAGVPPRAPRKPPDLSDPAVAKAVADLDAEIEKHKDLLAAIAMSRGLRQPQRRDHLFAATVVPASPGAAVGRHLKQVYLKLFSDGIYKIGETKNPDDRPGQLEGEYQIDVHHNKEYLSPVAHELEQALLRHFRHFRVERGGARELFDLPLEVVAQFEMIAEEVEKWVFNAEEARLKLELLRIETEYTFF
jgi:hypothetical protein